MSAFDGDRTLNHEADQELFGDRAGVDRGLEGPGRSERRDRASLASAELVTEEERNESGEVRVLLGPDIAQRTKGDGGGWARGTLGEPVQERAHEDGAEQRAQAPYAVCPGLSARGGSRGRVRGRGGEGGSQRVRGPRQGFAHLGHGREPDLGVAIQAAHHDRVHHGMDFRGEMARWGAGLAGDRGGRGAAGPHRRGAAAR